jgi:hypothetical protein
MQNQGMQVFEETCTLSHQKDYFDIWKGIMSWPPIPIRCDDLRGLLLSTST